MFYWFNYHSFSLFFFFCFKYHPFWKKVFREQKEHPASLSYLLEEDHSEYSEFPSVTLKLVRDRKRSSASLDESVAEVYFFSITLLSI